MLGGRVEVPQQRTDRCTQRVEAELPADRRSPTVEPVAHRVTKQSARTVKSATLARPGVLRPLTGIRRRGPFV